MTNKINGIDVSECKNFSCGICEEENKIPRTIGHFTADCILYPNCYYKQLKRLQEENEKQKELIKQLEDFIKTDGEIDHINHEYTYKLQKENEELYKALEEIRSYCDEQNLKADYTACYITNRIDEVLNDRDQKRGNKEYSKCLKKKK